MNTDPLDQAIDILYNRIADLLVKARDLKCKTTRLSHYPNTGAAVVSRAADMLGDCLATLGGDALAAARNPPTTRQIIPGHWYKRQDGEIVGPATTKDCLENEIQVGGHYYNGKHNGFRRGYFACRWILVEDLGPTDPREAKEITTPAPRFPIMTEIAKRDPVAPPMSIPWNIAELAYSVYSSRYGTSQTLQRLAERGGFGAGEMDTLLPGWREMPGVKP